MKDILKQKHIFVTGTDTGVGKSIFTSILALYFYSQGKKVAISKPIQTGKPDTKLLGELTGNKIPIFNTYSFSLPSAPVLAAKEEKKEIKIEKIISDIKKIEKEYDCVIIEGVGGIAVPIVQMSFPRKRESSDLKTSNLDSHFHGNDMHLVADLIKDLDYPVIIIARPTLGTINHTVLTIEFAKQKGLNISGFVISGYDENTNDPVIPPKVGPPLAEKTAPEIVEQVTNVNCLMKIPFFKNLSYKCLSDFSSYTASNFSFTASSKAPSCLAKL